MNETHQTAESKTPAVFRQKPDGSIDPAGEAGWFLQRERQRRGVRLDVAAQVLGIHESHLDGIEFGDLTKLPSRNEALAMIGIYGSYLGFDPKPLTQHYSRFLPRPVAVAARKHGMAPKPLSSAKIIPFATVLKLAMSNRGLSIVSSIVGIVLMMGVAGVMLAPKEEEQIAARVDSLPTASLTTHADDGSTVKIRQLPMAEDLAADEAVSSDPTAVDSNKLESGLDDLGAFIAQQLSEPTSNAEVPVSAKTNDITGKEVLQPKAGPGARLVLRAAGSVWFRVEDTRGNVIISQTLRKGESYAVPDRDDLVIIARDGGLISYELDGVDHGAVGTPGEIVVGRPLSISSLLNPRG
jgi:cytoskeleton protein RodZ